MAQSRFVEDLLEDDDEDFARLEYELTEAQRPKVVRLLMAGLTVVTLGMAIFAARLPDGQIEKIFGVESKGTLVKAGSPVIP